MLIHPETKTRTVVRIRSGRAIEEPLLGAIVRDANLPAEEFIEEFETCPNWGANFPTYVLIRRFSARSLRQQRW
jgi:hypothetical protein